MKKILYVATVVKTHIMLFHIPYLKMLKEMGWETAVAARNDYENPEDCKIPYCDTYYNLPFERSPFNVQNVKTYKMLKKIIEEENYDIIHCHTPMGAALARVAARKMRGRSCKVIYTAHGFHFFKGAPLKNWLFYYPVERFLSRWTDVLITINKEDYARAKKHMHAGQVEYIPGVGIDTKKIAAHSLSADERLEKRRELGIPDGSFVLLSVGELQSRKNHQVVIEALSELQDPNITYLIAGQGELYENYQKLIRDNNLSDEIRLLGFRSDISELCEIADCFVHPSVREGLGIAPLEAMASGLPLISGKINGMLDYTEDGKTGCCVEPRSVEKMKAAITKMYNDRSFREMCGKHNMEVVKAFSMEKSHQAMKRIYCEATK